MQLDMRTVVFSYGVSNAICTGIMALLWRQNRQRVDGLEAWLAGFACQFVGFVLVVLRGVVPDLLSIVAGNVILGAGLVLMYEGLARFTHQTVPRRQNYLLLAGFAVIHAYFGLVEPNVAVRDINTSVGMVIICSQSVWLVLQEAQGERPTITQSVGLISALYGLLGLLRIVLTVVTPPGDEFFADSSSLDVWVLFAFQMLSIAMALSLVLMVNRRLFLDLRAQGEALRLSEEKFARAFHASPDAIIITRARDGRFVEVNQGFCRLAGYTREEALSSSASALKLWVRPEERAEYIAALQAQGSVRNLEYDFIAKSGARLHCLCSGETITLNQEAHILSVVRDVTERQAMQARLVQQQQAAAVLVERERLAHELHDNLSQMLAFMNVQAQAAHECLVAGDSERADAYILRLAEVARETHTDTRQFIANSLIVISPESGFLPALRQSLEQFEQIRGLHTELEVETEAALAFEPTLELHLLRIIQEALNNARKHAQARNVRVRLRTTADQVCVLVTDDGTGFDTAHVAQAQGQHLGLDIMQERATELGGTLDIHSRPGQGTQIRLRFPWKE